MEELVKAAVEQGASVIHIKAGDVFRARIGNELVRLSSSTFTPEETRRIALGLIPTEAERKRIDHITDHDCSWELKDVGRFRVNILRQRGSFMIVMRVIPWEIPTLEELGLPPVLAEIADGDHGLVLVTGAVGFGTSATQAALIGWINRNRKKHIVTLEDPIEYLHRDERSTVTQRDVGVDTESFRHGLRAALRQDPDVILIGELRDRETIEIALRAAELGQLVISTMHTPNAASTISHLVAVFPEAEREAARMLLANALRAIVSQQLLPRADGTGRVPAVEILRVTGAIRDCILLGKPAEAIMELVEDGREAYGMQSFDQHLMELVQTGMVSYQVAKAAATSPSDFELIMQTLAAELGEEGGGLLPGEAFRF
ncbi:MAG: type IV pilus twitching motility protein PilT [Gemmatimonadota bacterium]